jgi:hypothetical protein
MIQLDTRLPLMAQGPNVLAAMDAGTVAAGNTANLLRQAEGQNLFRQYGAGAMQGDPNAMNALAGFDPVMAQGMDINRQENRRADQRLAIDQERLQIVRQETARAVSEAQNKAEAESQVRMLEQAFRAMDMGMRTGDMTAVTQGLRMFGLEQLPPQEGMQVAATMLAGGIEGLTAQYTGGQGFRPATPEEAAQYGAAGGQFGPDDRFYPVNPPSGFEVIQNADGTSTVRQGPGVGRGGGTLPGTVGVGSTFNPSDVNTALGLITDIHNSPDLPKITGPLAGGGGNDVEQLNIMQRGYYGSGGLATIEKIAQLQGQAWLAARDMLKGGGPITDYESRKAEQAVARLSRVKDEKEYQAALKDLHDAIREGMMKLQGAGKLPEGVQIPEPLSDSAPPPAQGSTASVDFSAMSRNDMNAVDLSTADKATLEAWLARDAELDAQE